MLPISCARFQAFLMDASKRPSRVLFSLVCIVLLHVSSEAGVVNETPDHAPPHQNFPDHVAQQMNILSPRSRRSATALLQSSSIDVDDTSIRIHESGEIYFVDEHLPEWPLTPSFAMKIPSNLAEDLAEDISTQGMRPTRLIVCVFVIFISVSSHYCIYFHYFC